MGNTLSNNTRPAWAFSIAIVLVLFGLSMSTAHFWHPAGLKILPSGSYALAPAFLLIIYAVVARRKQAASTLISPLAVSLCLLLIFFSDRVNRTYNFFPTHEVRGDIILLGAIFCVLSLRARQLAIKLAALLTPIFLAAVFLNEASGRLLFSDDHASFFFRLSLLKDKFPNIPFYFPFWNAGLDARDFFATGALNAFLLASPIVYGFDLEHAYNYIIAALLFLVLPASVWFASKRLQLRAGASEIAALLALCSGLVWYRWALKYGTVGFITSAALVPLVLVLTWNLIDKREKSTLTECLVLIAVSSLTLMWSASGLALLPLIAWAAVSLLLKAFKSQAGLFPKPVLIVVITLIIINLPWVALFWKVSGVSRFLKQDMPSTYQFEASMAAVEQPSLAADDKEAGYYFPAPEVAEGQTEQLGQPAFRHRPGKLDLRRSMQTLRESMIASNPLIIFFGVAGLFALVGTSVAPIALVCLWLLFLGTVMVPFKPQLELDRMLVVLNLILCMPAGALLSQVLLISTKGLVPRILSALAGGFLLVSPLCIASLLSNRSVEQYHFATPLVKDLAHAIAEHGGQGRVLFAGCIVHELDEGHAAPLALWSKKPLIASSPFHTLWRYTEVIPPSFMKKGESGIAEYLELMNVTAIVAHDSERRRYFSSRPSLYRQVWHQGRFTLYEVLNSEPSYALIGKSAVLSQQIDRIVVRVEDSEAIIKFNYFPFLTSSNCELSPYQAAPELTLIKLSSCRPGEDTIIQSVNPAKRLAL